MKKTPRSAARKERPKAVRGWARLSPSGQIDHATIAVIGPQPRKMERFWASVGWIRVEIRPLPARKGKAKR